MLTALRGFARTGVHRLEIGADDYLPKPFEPRELCCASATSCADAGPGEGEGATLPETIRFGAFVYASIAVNCAGARNSSASPNANARC